MDHHSADVLVRSSRPADVLGVALKAYRRIADAWSLTVREGGGPRRYVRIHLDAGQSAWIRRRTDARPMLRLSALVGLYKALELYFRSASLNPMGQLPTGGRSSTDSVPSMP